MDATNYLPDVKLREIYRYDKLGSIPGAKVDYDSSQYHIVTLISSTYIHTLACNICGEILEPRLTHLFLWNDRDVQHFFNDKTGG